MKHVVSHEALKAHSLNHHPHIQPDQLKSIPSLLCSRFAGLIPAKDYSPIVQNTEATSPQVQVRPYEGSGCDWLSSLCVIRRPPGSTQSCIKSSKMD